MVVKDLIHILKFVFCFIPVMVGKVRVCCESNVQQWGTSMGMVP